VVATAVSTTTTTTATTTATTTSTAQQFNLETIDNARETLKESFY